MARNYCGYVEEIELWSAKIREARAGIADITDVAKEELGVKPKVLKAFAKSYKDPSIGKAQEDEISGINAAVEVARNSGL